MTNVSTRLVRVDSRHHCRKQGRVEMNLRAYKIFAVYLIAFAAIIVGVMLLILAFAKFLFWPAVALWTTYLVGVNLRGWPFPDPAKWFGK